MLFLDYRVILFFEKQNLGTLNGVLLLKISGAFTVNGAFLAERYGKQCASSIPAEL